MRNAGKVLISIASFASSLAVAHACGWTPAIDRLVESWLPAADLTPEGDPYQNIIEQLDHPVRVVGWSSEALELEDGRFVELPGVRPLPEKSDLLTASTSSGVEFDSGTGRVVGLLRIWHWCGNDSTREHVARVDLARLLQFVQVSNDSSSYYRDCDRVDEWGWNVSLYLGFEEWLATIPGSK